MKEEENILKKYVMEQGLRNTPQRYKVLEVFLRNEGHPSVDELHDIVKKKYPDISHSTTFRTMQIIEAAGLAARIRGNDSVFRFEHLYNHSQHGHLVCLQCGKIIEFDNSEIIKLQNKISKEKGFKPLRYGAKISGICKNCQNNV